MVNNSDLAAKIEIRHHVMASLTPARTIVFDAFCGTGEMWEAVWQHAASYVGCDEKWAGARDPRRCFVADNRRVLRCIDLAPYTCFDLDAWSDGWEQAIIIAARRPPLVVGERLGLILTDGGWIPFAMAGRMSGSLRQASGISPDRLNLAALGGTDQQTTASARRATKAIRVKRFDDLITRACQQVAHKMQGRIVKEWRATGVMNPLSKGAYMRYRGLVIEGGA